MTIQDLCRDKKTALHLTAQDIADESGVPLSTVNNFFANASKSPSINTAGPICAVLGISLDEFFDIGDKLTMSEEVLSAKNDTLRAHKKELEKHLVDNDKTMKIMMDGVRTRNRIIAALLVLFLVLGSHVRTVSGLPLRPDRLLARVTHGQIPKILHPA